MKFSFILYELDFEEEQSLELMFLMGDNLQIIRNNTETSLRWDMTKYF